MRVSHLLSVAPNRPSHAIVAAALQESAQQAASQQSEQDTASASDSEEEHEREAYVLSEGGLDEDMESISFIIEELPEGLVASEYTPGAFQAVDMDSVDSSESLHLTVPALPDLAILADNRAPLSWGGLVPGHFFPQLLAILLSSYHPPPLPTPRIDPVHAWGLQGCGHGLGRSQRGPAAHCPHPAGPCHPC